MPIGTLQRVLVCVPSSQMAGKPDYGNCGAIAGVAHRYTVQQFYMVDPSNAQRLDDALQPFDYAYATSLWSLSFTFVLGLYLVSSKFGLVLSFIRRG